MSELNEREFNLKCAEYMGLESVGLRADGVEEYLNDRGGSQPFNPYQDANDRNKVLEKMRIRTYYNPDLDEWTSMMIGIEVTHFLSDKSMESAQIQCILEVLNETRLPSK